MALFQVQKCLQHAGVLSFSTRILPGTFIHRTMSKSASSYKRFIKNEAYINGAWVLPSSGKTFEILNPATGSVVGNAAECSVVDAKKAVEAAKNAFYTWRDFSGKERGNLLRKLFLLQNQHQEALARLITDEMGKPLVEARGEIAYGASFLDWFSSEATRIHGEILQSPWPDKQLSYYKEPSGVAGIITPVSLIFKP